MDETYIKVKGEWVYLYRAASSPSSGEPFHPTAQRQLRTREDRQSKASPSMLDRPQVIMLKQNQSPRVSPNDSVTAHLALSGRRAARMRHRAVAEAVRRAGCAER